MTSDGSFASDADALAALEARLKDLTELRDQMQACSVKLKDSQKELERRSDKKMDRPRDTVEVLDDKIAQLERDRTIRSMPLAEEKAILKAIHKLERARRAVRDYQTQEDRLRARRSRNEELRESLRVLRRDIDALRTEVTVTRMAVQLGCGKEALLGMKLECPADKIGDVIGRKGTHVKQIMEKASVKVDIAEGDIRLFGAMESLDAAAVDIGKVIHTKEEQVELAPPLVAYLLSRKIHQLQLLQTSHPNVHIHLPRRHAKMILRGAAEDIEDVKKDLETLVVVERTLELTSREASYIIGKRGQTIERLVEQHQILIQIDDNKEEASMVTVSGFESRVQLALKEILELVADAREGTESVPLSPIVKTLLLKNHGVIMKEIYGEASKVAREAGGGISLRMDGNSIIVRGNTMVLMATKCLIEAKVKKMEDSMIKITIDKSIIPQIVGKGGEVVKRLTGGTSVNIEFEEDSGTLVIIGLDSQEIENIKSAVEDIIGKNQLHRIKLHPAVYKRQLAKLLRTHGDDIRALCAIRGDDDDSTIVLRGEMDKLDSAVAIVNDFLHSNHIEDLSLSLEDLQLLSRGGPDCKLVQFEKEHDVSISTTWKDRVIYVQGEREKVVRTMEAINTYLFGGDDWGVAKIPLNDKALRTVIGKGGENLKSLIERFKDVSIIMKGDDSIVLRGPNALVDECRIEVQKRVCSAQITQEVDITQAHHDKLKSGRFFRDMMREVPVWMKLKGDSVSIRGVASDVAFVVAVLNEQLYGFYESRMVFDADQFRAIKEACEKPSFLDRIKATSGALIALAPAETSLIFRGKRDQVKAAKLELIHLLDFVLQKCFDYLPLPGSLAYYISKGTSIAEIAALSGTTVIIDRDTTCALLFSSDRSKLEKALEMLHEKIDKVSKTFLEIQLKESDAWLAALLVSENGSRINAIRKMTRCLIAIDINEHKISIMSTDGTGEDLEPARALIEAALDKERSTCSRLQIPSEDVSAFIGRKGSTVKAFRKTHSVEAEIVDDDIVILKGEPEAVAAARVAVEDFIKSRQHNREVAKKESEESLTLQLLKDQIPAIIGAKGAVINALVTEFGVKVDVDRSSSILTIRRGDSDSRLACQAKIREIIREQETSKVDLDSVDSKQVAAKRQSIRQTESPTKLPKQPQLQSENKLPSSINPVYFPPLVGKPGRSDLATSRSETTPKRSWASLASGETRKDHPPYDELEVSPEVIRTH